MKNENVCDVDLGLFGSSTASYGLHVRIDYGFARVRLTEKNRVANN